jgi:hypothetical protein
MRKRWFGRTTAVAILLAAFGSTVTEPAEARQMITGSQNTERTNRLTGEIKWHRSVAQAQEDARREGKLVFWVNMLGTLSGAT